MHTNIGKIWIKYKVFFPRKSNFDKAYAAHVVETIIAVGHAKQSISELINASPILKLSKIKA